MSPTIYDIARVAGVSKSTVSRVLNKQTNISPEAREKVLRAIEELQYQPNKLARALTSSGFDAIMVIDVHVSVDRVNGYKQSLEDHNIAVRDEWIVDGGYTHETALQAARELLSQSPLPEAVFATDSLKLMSIYRAAAEKNIAIPQQLAVVGYSNETLSFILTPAPGGIDVPTQELGQQSCELLFRLISGKPSPQNITVATHMTLK